MTDLEKIRREARLARGNLLRTRIAWSKNDDIETGWRETDKLFKRLHRIERLAILAATRGRARRRGFIRT